MAKESNTDTAQRSAEEIERAAEELQEAATRATEASQELADVSEQAGSLIEQIAAVADGGPSEFVFLFTIFLLAIVIGYYVVWSVTPALHTPLMSVTNAISSVVIVGALIALGADLSEATNSFLPKLFGFFGVALASVNIFGGFMVSQRMLAMYKKNER